MICGGERGRASRRHGCTLYHAVPNFCAARLRILFSFTKTHNASSSQDMGRTDWPSQPHPGADGSHCSLGIMKTTKGLTVQQADELVGGIGTTRGRGIIIDPLAFSFALAIIDLLLVEILAIAFTGFTTAEGSSSNEGRIFMFAPFIIALSLWQQGAYTVGQMPPLVFRAAIGCMN